MLPASIDHFRMQMRYGCDPADLDQDIAAPSLSKFISELDILKTFLDANDSAAIKQHLEELREEKHNWY